MWAVADDTCEPLALAMASKDCVIITRPAASAVGSVDLSLRNCLLQSLLYFLGDLGVVFDGQSRFQGLRGGGASDLPELSLIHI